MTAPLSPFDDAPLFALFWENSQLNPTRAHQMAERIGHDAVHPNVPPRPSCPNAAQPLPRSDSDLMQAYARRRSERAFDGRPLTAAELGHLLQPFAVRADSAANRHLPSGGGKYPVLVHVALYRVADARALQGRRAWYDPVAHGLAPTGEVPPWPVMAQALGVDWPEPPAMVVLFTARMDGMLRKYGERGGRFMLLEAGACMGALGLQLARMGLAGTALGSFLDREALAAFGLDPRDDLAVLAFACGASTSS